MSLKLPIEMLLAGMQVLLHGDFTLKDGSKSKVFVDMGRVSSGQDLSLIAIHLADKIKEFEIRPDVLVGPPYKAIPMVAVLSHWTGIPFDFYRKEEKDHGEGGKWVTKALKPGMKALIVDDVCTSGTAKSEAILEINKVGAISSGVLVVLDRTGEREKVCGVDYHYLTTLERLISTLDKAWVFPKTQIS
jgi:orotate phosphoribosyltransferase